MTIRQDFDAGLEDLGVWGLRPQLVQGGAWPCLLPQPVRDYERLPGNPLAIRRPAENEKTN